MPDISNLPVGLQSTTLADAPGVGDKLDSAGMAFGDLVKQVGMAVAETQRRLNETCAATANTLANTTVDVIAVHAMAYDDTGKATTSTNIKMPLPLVNFVNPQNYEVATLQIQGVFQATEFKAANTSTTDTTRYSGGASLHLGGWFSGTNAGSGVQAAAQAAESGSGGSYNYASQGSSTTTSGSATRQVQEFGQVRMNAEMIPRDDIGVPKPNHIVRGPSLLLVPQTLVTEPAEPSPEHPLQQRYTIIKLTYRRPPTTQHPTGAPIPGAGFAIETGGLPWNYCNAAGVVDESATSTLGETNADGVLYIKVRRAFSPGDDVTVRSFGIAARIGMVSASVPVNL